MRKQLYDNFNIKYINGVKVWLIGRFVIAYRNIRNQCQVALLLDTPLCSIVIFVTVTVLISQKSAYEPLIYLGRNNKCHD